MWDSSTQPDDAAWQKQVETYRLLFKMLRNCKHALAKVEFGDTRRKEVLSAIEDVLREKGWD